MYLLYLNSIQKKKNIEKFYIRENFVKNSGKKINFDKDTLYIYTAQRELVSCKEMLKILKNNKEIPDNIPIAGLPNFDFNEYDASNGFSKSIGLPAPTSIHGKLFDYVMSMLTSINNIDYYTTDNKGSKIDPVLDEKYYYNKTVREKIDIEDTEFINIMKEFFRILTACNNNTTVRFIRYYKKDTATIDDEGKRHFDEIDEKDLEIEIKSNNVMIFYENINIINFLQVSNPKLFKEYSKYNNKLFTPLDI